MAIADENDQLPVAPLDTAPIAPSIAEQQRAHAESQPPPPATDDSLPVAPTSPSILGTSWPSLSDITHKLGVGTRDVAEGIGSIVGGVGDVLTYPGRALGKAIGYQPKPWQPGFYDAPSTQISQALDATGLPVANTPTEQNISTYTRGASAALAPAAAAAALPAVGATIAPSLATLARTAMQGGSGALVGQKVAGSDLVPPWLKPTVAFVAGGLGAKLGDVGANLAGKTINALSGNVSPQYQAFVRSGIDPNLVGTASGSETGQAIESALSRMPFASSIMRPAQQQTIDQFGNAIDRTANQLNPAAVTAENTGDIVQNSFRNWRDNVFPQQQAAVWGPLNQRLAGAAVTPDNYRTALDNLTTNLLLPETQQVLTPARAMALRDAINADVPPNGAMQWWQAQRLRSLIGATMGVPQISESVGMDALRRAYGGISQDMRNTAVANGMETPFDAANALSTAGHAFIENTGAKIARANNPYQESITPEQATTNLLNSGDTALQQVRQNMPDAADALAAFKTRQMAYAKPSVAGAYNDTSTGTFLTNYNRMMQNQPGGAAALYNDPAVQQQMDDLATAAASLRATERHLNTSGTAEQLGWMNYLKDITESQNWRQAISRIAAPPTIGKVAGTVMTNPTVARFAAAPGLGLSPQSPWLTGLLGNAPLLTGQ